MDEEEKDDAAEAEEFGLEPTTSKKGKGRGEILLPDDDLETDEPADTAAILDDDLLSADALADEEDDFLPEDSFTDDMDTW